MMQVKRYLIPMQIIKNKSPDFHQGVAIEVIDWVLFIILQAG
jgi:hypothetical protein